MFNWTKSVLKQVTTRPAPPQREERFDRIQIAACVLLLEVAKSDDEFCSLEKETVTAILNKEFSIPQEAVEELMEIAHSKREESVGLYEFTDVINENFSREEKIKIIELTWRVIYADKKLNAYEDHLVHRLAKLLRLHHDELIDAKLRVLHG